MTATTVARPLSTAPQVNLLPSDVQARRNLGVAKRWLAASVGVTALAVGVVSGVAQLRTADAAAELAEAQQQTADLLAAQQPFLEVSRLRADIDMVDTARRGTMATEILWSDYLGAVAATTPEGVRITSLAYTEATPLAGGQPAAGGVIDPATDAAVGTLTFTARASGMPDTVAWVDDLEDLRGLTRSTVTGVALVDFGGTLEYEITGTVQVDDGAFSRRFDAPREGDR